MLKDLISNYHLKEVLKEKFGFFCTLSLIITKIYNPETAVRWFHEGTERDTFGLYIGV